MRLVTRGSAITIAIGREERVAGLSILHLEGALRAPVGLDLRRRVEALLGHGRRCILLDLANVTDLDAAGLGELVRVYRRAGTADGELWIRNPTGKIRKLLELAGLYEVLRLPSPFAFEKCS
jgi:anti-sigma B factor antagonist